MKNLVYVQSVRRLIGWKAAVAVLITIVLTVGCSSGKEETSSSPTTIKTIKTLKVTKQQISGPEQQVAEVQSSVALDVVTKTTGDVIEVLKKKGDSVHEGDILFRMDTKDALLAKDKAEIALRSAEIAKSSGSDNYANNMKETENTISQQEKDLSEAIRSYNKAKNDYEYGSIDKAALTQAQNALTNLQDTLALLKSKKEALMNSNTPENLELNLKNAKVAFEEVNRNLEQFNVKATGSGVITEMKAEVGMTISAGTSAAKIEKTDPVKLTAELNESNSAKLMGKNELSVLLGDGSTVKGMITYLSAIVNPTTKSFPVELEVPNPDLKLRPGTKAQLILTEARDQVVTAIPATAVVREDNNMYVFVLKDSKAERRRVELGRLNSTLQEVLAGIQEGEQIVISGQNQLKDGEPVQVEK